MTPTTQINTAPKERPILFSAPMVRAILAGSKTQTRRIAKHPLAVAARRVLSYKGQTEFDCVLSDGGGGIIHCPHGQPGELLWVREAYRFHRVHDHVPPRELLGAPVWHGAQPLHSDGLGKLRPSIHMPRWASRITLRVNSVRVQRLQEISEPDAMAEGIVQLPDGGCGLADTSHYHATDPRQSFFGLWESINGPGSVQANPWVWVVGFEQVKQ